MSTSSSSPKDERLTTTQETIQRELDRIAVELRNQIPDDRYITLYAAHQALAWVTNPGGIMPPYEAIMNGKVRPLIPDTHQDSEDCSAALRHSLS